MLVKNINKSLRQVGLHHAYELHDIRPRWRRGLMVRVLDSGSSGLASGPGWGHCVVFSGKTLSSHGASLYQGVYMGTRQNAGGNPVMDKHPNHGGVDILLVASCFRNQR